MQGSSPNLTQLQVAVGLLAQFVPPGGVEQAIYQVPASNRTFISELAVCNRGAGAASFRFSISKGGAATANTDYLYFNIPIGGNDTFASDIGVTLSVADTIRVFASNGNLTFTLFGMPV
jgi:hypothetical protein